MFWRSRKRSALTLNRCERVAWMVFGHFEGARTDRPLYLAIPRLVQHLLRINERARHKGGEHQHGRRVQTHLEGVFVEGCERRDAREEVLAKGVELPPPLQRGDSIGCGQLFAVIDGTGHLAA